MLSSIFKNKHKKQSHESTNEPNLPQTNDKQTNTFREEVTLEECDSKTEKKLPSDNDKYNAINPDPDTLETTMAKSIRTKTPVQHVVLDVNWSGIFDEELLPNLTKWKYNPKSCKTIEKGKDAWTIEILSPSECIKLIELCEMYGFEDCGYPKNYRSNTRLITDDKSFVDLLYERVKLCCPKQYKADGVIWEICGLNERFRWCKYVKGQKFGRHCDARFCRKSKEKSFYTVNVYLNDGKTEFKGGRTLFWNANRRKMQWEISVGVTASPGLALIFNQYPDNIEHSGEEVMSGVKYLMRTDVMYRTTAVKGFLF